MKRFIAVIAAVLILLSLAACGETVSTSESGRFTITKEDKSRNYVIYVIDDNATGAEYMAFRTGYGVSVLKIDKPSEQSDQSDPIETSEHEQTARYELSDAERTVVEQVVMAEAGGEPYDGQVAVAQCILAACEKDGIAPSEAVEEYGYTSNRCEPSESVVEAVSSVFDRGDTAVDEPIIYFYAPDRVKSSWHESQVYVITIGNHRFFKEG